jgi:hypothetical protein
MIRSISNTTKHNLTRDVQIDAIGVWDTVGTLGLPITPLLQNFGFPTTIHKYRFFDTTLSNHIKNAFHALALDERRSAFQATVWEKKPGNNTVSQWRYSTGYELMLLRISSRFGSLASTRTVVEDIQIHLLLTLHWHGCAIS